MIGLELLSTLRVDSIVQGEGGTEDGPELGSFGAS